MKFSIMIEGNSKEEVRELSKIFAAMPNVKMKTEVTTEAEDTELEEEEEDDSFEMKLKKSRGRPKKEEPEEEEEEEEEPVVSKKTTVKSKITKEELIKKLQSFCKKESNNNMTKGRQIARKLLKKFSVETPEDLDPSEYADFMEAMK